MSVPLNDMMHDQQTGNYLMTTLLDAYSASVGEVVVSASVDVGIYSQHSINVSTNENCNVYYQVSDDDVTWYEPLKNEDLTPTIDGPYPVDTKNYNIKVTGRPTKYMRVVVQAVAAATITVVLTSQV